MYFYNTLVFILGIFFKMFYRIEVTGIENISKDEGVLLCSNHVNVLDPIILSIVVPRQIFWMGKKELFKNKILSYVFHKLGAFPVDRKNTELSTIKHSIRLLRDKGMLGIFPEGTRVDKMDLENAKPGVALISVKSKTPIIPVHIKGNYKPFSKIKVRIGESFDFSEGYGEKLTTDDYQIYGQDILSRIYLLESEQEEL